MTTTHILAAMVPGQPRGTSVPLSQDAVFSAETGTEASAGSGFTDSLAHFLGQATAEVSGDDIGVAEGLPGQYLPPGGEGLPPSVASGTPPTEVTPEQLLPIAMLAPAGATAVAVANSMAAGSRPVAPLPLRASPMINVRTPVDPGAGQGTSSTGVPPTDTSILKPEADSFDGHRLLMPAEMRAVPETALPRIGAQPVAPGAQAAVPDLIANNSAAAQTAVTMTPASPLAQPVQAGAESVAALNRPLGQAGWDNDLGNRIQWMAGKNMQSAEIRLNPQHLGPLEVRVSVQGDQTSVSFFSQHSVVRESIEAAMPRLREMLAEQGITLGDTSVSDRGKGDDAPAQEGTNLANGIGQGGTSRTEDVNDGAVPVQMASADSARINGRIDFFA